LHGTENRVAGHGTPKTGVPRPRRPYTTPVVQEQGRIEPSLAFSPPPPPGKSPSKSKPRGFLLG